MEGLEWGRGATLTETPSGLQHEHCHCQQWPHQAAKRPHGAGAAGRAPTVPGKARSPGEGEAAVGSRGQARQPRRQHGGASVLLGVRAAHPASSSEAVVREGTPLCLLPQWAQHRIKLFCGYSCSAPCWPRFWSRRSC